jgi:preprotein translocase subunit SecG
MLYGFLIVLIGILAVVLTLVVLLQAGKGGGLAGMTGGQTQQILGARQAPDLLEKVTWTLGTALIVLCIVTVFAHDDGEGRSPLLERGAPVETQAPIQTAPPVAPAPAETPTE